MLRLWILSLTPSRGSSARRRPGSRPRTRQPLWWNDACYHALVARNGSWRDFRHSGSPERLSTVSQHSSFLQDPLLERVAWLCDVPLSPCSQARMLSHGPLVPLLTFAICSGVVPLALPSLLTRRVPFGAPIFPPQLGTLLVLTIFPLSFFPLPCTNLADLMRPSLAVDSLLHSPSATSLHQVRTASHTHSSKSLWWCHLLLSFFNLVLPCGSVRLEVQPCRPGHRFWRLLDLNPPLLPEKRSILAPLFSLVAPCR